jgi:hypothetical protein
MWPVRIALSESLVAPQAFYDLVVSPKRRRAVGNNAIRDSVLHHDGNAHPCHAHSRNQGCTCVERHDARPAFHDRFLESHLSLAQGIPFNQSRDLQTGADET